jgi:hypothetical protein
MINQLDRSWYWNLKENSVQFSILAEGRGVNGTDGIHSYSSLDSFRGVNIHPYPSPDIQYSSHTRIRILKFRFLWCRYPFISYPTHLTLPVPDLNPRRKINVCIRIRRYLIVFDPFTFLTEGFWMMKSDILLLKSYAYAYIFEYEVVVGIS